MRSIRPKLTYANVVSTLALFLVLGGGAAFAASKLAKNSVGTRQLRNNAVTTAKLRAGAVTGAKIKDGTISGAKIDLGSLGTVPRAQTAVTADSAGSARSSQTANAAETAKTADLARVANLAKDSEALGGIGPSAFTREASSAIAANALVHTDGSAREVTIAVPRDGFLLAVASADVYALHANDYYTCFIYFEGTALPQSERSSQLAENVNEEENCSTNAMIPVAAGTHNVRFNFNSVGPSTVVDQAELDVVFIPFSS